MKKADFDKLVTSVRQAGRIRRGQMAPGRVKEFAPVDVKAVRRRLGKSQSEFARMIGVSWRRCRTGSRVGADPKDRRAHC